MTLALLFALVAPTFADDPQMVASAKALRPKLDALVRDELTKRWYPAAVDKTQGGFHQNYARDWTPTPDDSRFVVYQSRMTWTAAAFARYAPERRQEFLEYVRHGVNYLDTVIRDKEAGGFHWMLDASGQVDPRIGAEKHAYGTAFVLYAASEAYAVGRDPRALAVARDAFDWLEKHAHDPKDGGYFEAFTREGRPILSWVENAPMARRVDRVGVYYGYKSMNAHIHLLEALAEFSKIDNSTLVKTRFAEVFEVVRDKIAVAPGALNLYFTPDWRAVPAHDSFGHDVETAYLLVEAAAALGKPDDPETWRVAKSLVDHALDWGWDTQSGGFYYKGEAFAGEAFDTHKDWWTQAEGLNALLLMHRKYGASTNRYWDAFLKEWAFIEAHLIDPVHGGWYDGTTREGRLIGDGHKAAPWKANYHTSRSMMNVATMLGEIERGK